MSSLSSKSAEELVELLDEYGIKHGPVVDSTRSLYEKKLREAMAKKKGHSTSDRTCYREEEEEEIIYVHRPPVRSECLTDSELYRRPRSEQTKWELGTEKSYSSPSRPAEVYRERALDEFTGGAGAYPSGHWARGEVYSGQAASPSQPYMYSPSTYRNISMKPTPPKSAENLPEVKSSRLVPRWIQFVFFLAVAFFFYFVFINMETTESDPFKKIS